MTNQTQRVRMAIYTLLALLALTLTMTGWYAHGLVKNPAPRDAPLAASAYQACAERLGDISRPLCARFNTLKARTGS